MDNGRSAEGLHLEDVHILIAIPDLVVSLSSRWLVLEW